MGFAIESPAFASCTFADERVIFVTKYKDIKFFDILTYLYFEWRDLNEFSVSFALSKSSNKQIES
jgi:hypothetical protein